MSESKTINWDDLIDRLDRQDWPVHHKAFVFDALMQLRKLGHEPT